MIKSHVSPMLNAQIVFHGEKKNVDNDRKGIFQTKIVT